MSETATFTITGYEEPAPGEIEALLVAERRNGAWLPVGRVAFGISKAMLEVLAPLVVARSSREGLRSRRRSTCASGRDRNGLIPDGVLLRG